MIRRVLIICLLAGLALVLVAADAGWYVPAQITVQAEEIYLGDLIRSTTGADLPETIESSFLMRAPRPGSSRNIDGSYLRSRLETFGLNSVRVPDRINVQSAAMEISPEVGEAAVRRYIRSNAPWPESRYRIEVMRRHRPISVLPGEVSAHVLNADGRELAGRHTYQVEYRQADKKVAQGSFSVEVHVTAKVFLAAHRVHRGAVLAETDLVEREMDLASVRGKAIIDRGQLIGARCRRTLNEGDVFTNGSVEPVPVVHRGDAVMVIAQREGLRVTAFGVARENGSEGDVIKVLNVQSNKTIHARVIDQNTVQVFF